MNKRISACFNPPQRSGSFHMTQKVDYALFLLTVLAQSSSHVSLRTIAQENRLSFAFLQKMAGLLRSAGLIQATRGNTGGYILALPVGRILFRDVVYAVEGEIAPLQCVSKRRSSRQCPRRAFCAIRPALRRIHAQMQDLYLSKPLTYFLSQQ